MQDEPRLPGRLEYGITEFFYELSDKLRAVEGLVRTLNRFDIITEDEMRVLYHNSHTKIVEMFRGFDG